MDATKKAVKEEIVSRMNAMDPTGSISKAKMGAILEGVGMPKDDAHLLLSAIDVNQDDVISHEEFVSWIFKTDQGISDGASGSSVTLRVETMTGDLAAVLHMSLENTVWEVKGRLAEVTDIPRVKQQLVLQDSVLKNNAYLHTCGIHRPDAVLTLVRRVTVPKLSELEVIFQKWNTHSDAGAEDMLSMLQILFQHHDLNKPILVPEGFAGTFEGEFDEESGGAYEEYDLEHERLQREARVEAEKETERLFERFGPDEAMEDLGFETGAPALWHVADLHIMVKPGAVSIASKWMLSRGALPDVEWKDRSVSQMAMQSENTALLRHLSLAGAKPSLRDLLDKFPKDDYFDFGCYNLACPTLSAKLEFLDLVLELAKSYPLEDQEKAFVDCFHAKDYAVWSRARFLDLGVTSDIAVLGWWADKQSDIKLLAASMDAAMQEAIRLDPELDRWGVSIWPEDLQTRYGGFLKQRREEEGHGSEEEECYGNDEF